MNYKEEAPEKASRRKTQRFAELSIALEVIPGEDELSSALP
jgi:hypothetical protein